MPDTTLHDALIRLAIRKQIVDDLSKKIEQHLVKCYENNADTYPYKSHLTRAYATTTDRDSYFGEGDRRLTPNEALKELEGNGEDESLACEHCAAAQRLIMQRKQARIKLGNAKGAITRMAQHLYKQGMTHD